MNKKQIDSSYGYANLQIPKYKLYDYKIERNDMNYQEALKHIANVLKIFEENASVDFIRKNEELTTLEDFKILQQAIDRNELLEKALEIATSDDDVNELYIEDLGIYCIACLEECNKEKRQKCIINKCLELARKELENGK